MAANHHQNDTVGFHLLPSELIQNILLYLSLPEILHMKLVNKSTSLIISDQSFIRECNSRSTSSTWLFVCKKRWRNELILHGFSDDKSHRRWFKIPISDLLKPVIYPGEDIYFLTANGNIFLFVSNTRQEVFAVNLAVKTVKRIPPSPWGPRGTSSWRRSGMKMITGSDSDHFRFLFAELVENQPILFEYRSETDSWRSTEAKENPEEISQSSEYVFLNVMNGASGSTVIATKVNSKSNFTPVVARPVFNWGPNELSVVGFSSGSGGRRMNRMHVYGDGYMMIIKSNEIRTERFVKAIELWRLNRNENDSDLCVQFRSSSYASLEYMWKYLSRVRSEIMEKINKKPFGVLMGCLEHKNGIIKVVLMSNLDGLWDIIWLNYDTNNGEWDWVQVPNDSNTKGTNMAGISFSSGPTLLVN
jgi:hypothetical protein